LLVVCAYIPQAIFNPSRFMGHCRLHRPIDYTAGVMTTERKIFLAGFVMLIVIILYMFARIERLEEELPNQSRISPQSSTSYDKFGDPAWQWQQLEQQRQSQEIDRLRSEAQRDSFFD